MDEPPVDLTEQMRQQSIVVATRKALAEGVRRTDHNYYAFIRDEALADIDRGLESFENHPGLLEARVLVEEWNLHGGEIVSEDSGDGARFVSNTGRRQGVESDLEELTQPAAQYALSSASLSPSNVTREQGITDNLPSAQSTNSSSQDRDERVRALGDRYGHFIREDDERQANKILENDCAGDRELAYHIIEYALDKHQRAIDTIKVVQLAVLTESNEYHTGDYDPSTATPSADAKRTRADLSSPPSGQSGSKLGHKKTKTAGDQDPELDAEDEASKLVKSNFPRHQSVSERYMREHWDPEKKISQRPLGEDWLYECPDPKRCLKNERGNVRTRTILGSDKIRITCRKTGDFEGHMRREHDIPTIWAPDKKGVMRKRGFLIIFIDHKSRRWYGKDHANGNMLFHGDFVKSPGQWGQKAGGTKTTRTQQSEDKAAHDDGALPNETTPAAETDNSAQIAGGQGKHSQGGNVELLAASGDAIGTGNHGDDMNTGDEADNLVIDAAEFLEHFGEEYQTSEDEHRADSDEEEENTGTN